MSHADPKRVPDLPDLKLSITYSHFPKCVFSAFNFTVSHHLTPQMVASLLHWLMFLTLNTKCQDRTVRWVFFPQTGNSQDSSDKTRIPCDSNGYNCQNICKHKQNNHFRPYISIYMYIQIYNYIYISIYQKKSKTKQNKKNTYMSFFFMFLKLCSCTECRSTRNTVSF